MAIPEEKAPSIDDMLSRLSGKDRKTVIEGGKCAMCEKPNLNFREVIDRREYEISGLCQDC